MLSDLCELCNRDGTYLLIISRGFRKDMMKKNYEEVNNLKISRIDHC